MMFDEAGLQTPEAPAVLRRRTRWLWLMLGHGAMGVGLIGALLPLVPTTPLLLVAAWAYTRSSPALRDKLYAHPRFGEGLRQWQENGAISRRAKGLAVIGLIISWSVAVWASGHPAVPYVMGAVALLVSAFILSRPVPVPDEGPGRPARP